MVQNNCPNVRTPESVRRNPPFIYLVGRRGNGESATKPPFCRTARPGSLQPLCRHAKIGDRRHAELKVIINMVGVAVSEGSKSITILGHGLTVEREVELISGVFVSPTITKLDLDATVAGCRHFRDYAAAIQGCEIATFALRIEHGDGGKFLAVKAWNALWLFHLLSVACRTPCFSLYSVCDGQKPMFSAANPSPFVRPLSHMHAATAEEFEWARRHAVAFDELIKVPEFSAAMRCYGNAQLLPEQDVRIMLLWSGI